jgi:hypothetical protein
MAAADTDAAATPTQPFLENSDFVLENRGVTIEWKTEASLDPVITMSLHQPCEVPRMQIRARTYNLKLKRLNDTIKPERIHIIFPAPTPVGGYTFDDLEILRRAQS